MQADEAGMEGLQMLVVDADVQIAKTDRVVDDLGDGSMKDADVNQLDIGQGCPAMPTA